MFGSRLALRLVLLFSLVAILPGALVYAVSVQFLGRSIESWFDVRVDRALDGGINLGRSALDYLLKETSESRDADRGVRSPMRRARPGPALEPRRRAGRRVRSGAVRAVRQRASPSAGLGGGMTPEPLPGDALRRARLQQTYAKVEQTQDAGLMLRVVVPVNSGDRLDPLRVLQVIERVPRTLAQDLEKVQAGARDYQEISFSRAALKRLYQLTLTLTLLLALTSALGLAVVLSERFADAARPARRGHARGRAGRFHAPPAGDVARRARRAHRIVQHDDGATRRRAGEDARNRSARPKRRAPTSKACSATCRRACWRSTSAIGCAPPIRARP